MSVLVVGFSHRSAPVSVLERLALDADNALKLSTSVAEHEHVNEAAVLATCNRVEVYADVDRFHGGVEAISRLLCDRADASLEELLPHMYVHYDDGAISHLFHVAAGLDSLAVGEGQVLGQTREALRLGQEAQTVGPALNLLFQQALRVGKRAHAETDIDQSAPSMVTAALTAASEVLGDLTGQRALIVGAGSMAALAAATTSRAGAQLTVVNRSDERAERLATAYAGRARPLAELAAAIEAADVVISATGAAGVVITADQIAARTGRPLALIDLAMPHDIDTAVADLDGVHLINLATLAATSHGALGPAADEVRHIVAEELAAFGAARRSANVTPTLVALRSMATSVVETELDRLRARLGDLDQAQFSEVAQAVRRVADKLIHQPTVRVKELAAESATVSYATALAELFALDPDAVDAVTAPQDAPGGAR